MNDVEILGRERRAMDHRCCATDHDELHAGVDQRAYQLGDVSFLRM